MSIRLWKPSKLTPNAWFAKGEIARLQGKAEEALPHYDRAIELAPRFVAPRLARARIIIDWGKHLDAEPDILAIRGIDAQNPHAAFLHALILALKDKVKEVQAALVATETIPKDFPARVSKSHPLTLFLLGVVSYYRKDYSNAYRHLTAYLKHFPQHLGALKLLASLALSNGDSDYAMHLLERLAPHTPKDIEILAMYGGSLMRARRHREAIGVLEKAASITDPGYSALSRLVMLGLTAGRNADAGKMLKLG